VIAERVRRRWKSSRATATRLLLLVGRPCNAVNMVLAMSHYQVMKKFRAARFDPDNPTAESNLTDFGPGDEIELITNPRHGSSLVFQSDGLLFTQDRATLMALCAPACDPNEHSDRHKPRAHAEDVRPPVPKRLSGRH
jgi:hypothetical protein